MSAPRRCLARQPSGDALRPACVQPQFSSGPGRREGQLVVHQAPEKGGEGSLSLSFSSGPREGQRHVGLDEALQRGVVQRLDERSGEEALRCSRERAHRTEQPMRQAARQSAALRMTEGTILTHPNTPHLQAPVGVVVLIVKRLAGGLPVRLQGAHHQQAHLRHRQARTAARMSATGATGGSHCGSAGASLLPRLPTTRASCSADSGLSTLRDRGETHNQGAAGGRLGDRAGHPRQLPPAQHRGAAAHHGTAHQERTSRLSSRSFWKSLSTSATCRLRREGRWKKVRARAAPIELWLPVELELSSQHSLPPPPHHLRLPLVLHVALAAGIQARLRQPALRRRGGARRGSC